MLANKGKERHVMSMELVDVSFVDNYLNITINHDFYGGVAFFMSRLAFKGKCNSMMLVEVHRSLSLIQIPQIQNFEKKKKGGERIFSLSGSEVSHVLHQNGRERWREREMRIISNERAYCSPIY